MRVIMVVLLVFVCISACRPVVPVPMSCDQLMPVTMHNMPFEQLNRSNVLEWVQREFGINASKVTVVDGVSGGRIVVWQHNQEEYRATFPSSGVKKITVKWIGGKPSLQNVLDCLGEPDAYRAIYKPDIHGQMFLVELWYPKRGAVIQLARLESGITPPQIDGILQFDLVVLSQPRTTSEVLAQDVYPELTSAEIDRDIIPFLRLWPGTLKDLRVDD